ncbi:hypothetical protein JKG47_19075 [Acidithiobacillus sp. MC6.1]|nr:hypothetical protein [Acidithiobacillus sp. MC6.1]
MNSETFHADEVQGDDESDDASREAGREKDIAMRRPENSRRDVAVLNQLDEDYRNIGNACMEGDVSRKTLSDLAIQRLAMVANVEYPEAWYTRILVHRGFNRRTARKIVNKAYQLAKNSPKTALAQALSAPAIAGGVGVVGKEKAAAATNRGIVPVAVPVDDEPVTRLTDFMPLPLSDYRQGRGLYQYYPEIFEGYSLLDYRRPQTTENSRGTYFPSANEMTKYGKIWISVGFQMVPEDLPRVLPALRKSGLLKFYSDSNRPVAHELLRELEDERQNMIVAGMNMDLARAIQKQ